MMEMNGDPSSSPVDAGVGVASPASTDASAPIIRAGANVRIVGAASAKRESKTEAALRKEEEKKRRRRRKGRKGSGEDVATPDGDGGGGEGGLLGEAAVDVNIVQKSAPVRSRPRKPLSKRYNTAMKALIPYRPKPKEGRELPLQDIGCYPYLTTSWMNGTMLKAFRVGLSRADIMPVSEDDGARSNAERLQRIWKEEQEKEEGEEGKKKKKKGSSLERAIWRFSRTRFVVATVSMMLSIFLQFLGPSLLLKALLDYLTMPEAPDSDGWWLVALLIFVQFFRNVFFALSLNIGIQTVLRLFGATQYLSFSKMLRLASANEEALGKLITFFTGDAERMGEAVVLGVVIFGTPVLFILSLIYSWILVGPWSLLGLVIILLFYPIMGGLAALTSVLRRRALPFTDRRTAMMNEVLGAIRLVKMYAWEESFQQRIRKMRVREMGMLKQAAFLQSVSLAVTPSITVIASVVTLLGLTYTGFRLTAPDAFTLFSIFTALQFTVGVLPHSLRAMAESRVSIARLQQFMDLPEYRRTVGEKEEEGEAGRKTVIRLEGATMGWPVAKHKLKDTESPLKKEKSGKEAENSSAPLLPENCAPEIAPCLFDLSLEVSEGELLGVAGPVGAGKSSLVAAVMGEMARLSGQIRIRGQLALVSQQAWIFGGTLRENILFGAPFNREKFDGVVEACALEPDLKALPDGDLTEIGERGMNLSGGQKQRVNLARAVYSDSDLFLLDDPLSAVDARVATHIFRRCVRGALRGKTVVLVTHGMQFLEQCDKVVFVKDGRIVEKGTHAELVARGEGEYLHMLSFDQTRKDKKGGGRGGDRDKEDKEQDEDGAEKGIEEEEVKRRREEDAKEKKEEEEEEVLLGAQLEADVENAGWSVMVHYMKACGGYPVAAFLLAVMLLFLVARLFTSIWLQIWMDAGDGLEEQRKALLANTSAAIATSSSSMTSEGAVDDDDHFSTDPTSTILHGNLSSDVMTLTESELKGFVTDNPDVWFYQAVYLVTVGVMLALGFVKGFSIAVAFLRGSTKMHDQMLHRVMRSPMSFFDMTPVGRILNRFSKDMDEMDVRLPFYAEFAFQGSLICVTQICLVCALYPLFVPPLLLVLAAFLGMDYFMNRGVVWTRKLDNITKSPVLHHLSSAAAGVAVIRCYGRQAVVQRRFGADLDAHLSAQALGRFSNRWFTFRMDLFGLAIILLTASFVVAGKGGGAASTAIAGLALSNVFQTCTFIPFVMRIKAELKARFNSVERVSEYAHDLAQEAAQETDPSCRPPPGWPHSGALSMRDVTLRYRPALPPALREISLEVRPGEKVGVVGRTGAGKTSLVAAILRLTEVESGTISIDGVDLRQLGLNDVRRAVAVIPQDPTLFQGTLRYNLDPFERHTDEAIWRALEKAHLREKKEIQLEAAVDADGENYSVGEKQLICLARAMLRGNRLLLLDEATASVDVRTDSLIQSTIRESFSDCTVVTVAHRLHTVLAYDRVAVMDCGRLVEFGTPEELRVRPGGAFAAMMESVREGVGEDDRID